MIGNGDLEGITLAGELYITNADAYSINITVADTYGQLTGFHKGKENLVTVGESAGEMEIHVGGTYNFDGVASLFPSAGMIVHFAVFVNGVIQYNIESGIDFKNSQNTQTFSGTGLLSLVKGDIVSVRGKSDTVPVSITVNHMNISLFRIGN